jgi:predicted PhzF superfamily epimerase YddE/YHI9
MLKLLLILGTLIAASSLGLAQADVRVELARPLGPGSLEEQTQATAIRDYLQAWHTVSAALESNNPEMLDRDFVGTARDKLAEAIQQQAALGLHTHYQDKSHDIQIVFYSPEKLSIQLTDNVDYEVQVLDHDKIQATQQVHAHYVVVLTPAEVRWRVRVFQAQFE